MGKKRKALSHEEIWDDTGLIRSWDESYEEYKLYHSIAARGERVEDVLKADSDAESASPSPNDPNEEMHDAADTSGHGSIEEGELDENSEQPMYDRSALTFDDQNIHASATAAAGVYGADAPETATLPHLGQPAFPQSMVESSSKDENVKNLMMAWYWAGYYSGYHEGQQQARDSATEPLQKKSKA